MPRTNADSKYFLFLAAAICALVYLPRINAPFIWDDLPTIAWNGAFDRAIPFRNFLSREYFQFAQEQFWRPVVTLSYYALSRGFGKSPWAFRLLSLALHAANVALLYGILKHLKLKPAACAIAAAMLAVNAVHTETVICSTFNQELLCAFGLLWMLRAHQAGRLWLAAAGFAFSLLSKEPGAVALPLAAAYDVCCRDRKSKSIVPDTESLLSYGVYFVVLIFYLWYDFLYMRSPGSQVGAAAHLPLNERVFYGFQGIVIAVRAFLIPVRLRVDYFAVPAESPGEWIGWVAGGTVLMALWIWNLARSWRRDRVLFYFLLWPLLFLSITSGLFPVAIFNMRLMAERWLYLPAIGGSAVLGMALSNRSRVAMALVCFWGACGLARAQDWARESRLYESLVKVYPWSAKAQEGLGEAYFHEKRFPEAIAVLEEALRLRETAEDKIIAHYAGRPGAPAQQESPSIYRWLGHTYAALGDLERADENFREAVRLDPGDGFSYQIMAYSYAEKGRFKDARRWLDAGLRANPGNDFLLRLKPGVEAGRLPFRANFY